MADYPFHSGKGIILNNFLTALVPTAKSPSKIIALDIECGGDISFLNSLYYDRGFEREGRRIELVEEPLFSKWDYRWKVLSGSGNHNVLMELELYQIYNLMEGNTKERATLRAREDFFLLFKSEDWVDSANLSTCCLNLLCEVLIEIKETGSGCLLFISDFRNEENEYNRKITDAMAGAIDDYYRFESKADGLHYNMGFHHDAERAKKTG